MQNPCWLDADGTEVPFGAEYLLIDSGKVKWVEFGPKLESSL